jgi:hypothetical protein
MILPQLTEFARDQQAKLSAVLRVGEATHHLAAVMASANAEFWSLPTERLLAVLNSDVSNTLSIFSANTQLGTMVNTMLETLLVPQMTSRAPTEPGRSDISFDGTSFFLVEPDPEQQ